MTYRETIQYLDSLINYEKKCAYPYRESFKLERIKEFFAVIGNPQDALKCIHVAGTKGKGSVCAFCAYILKEAGYKVGLYTSPHLSDVRERIRVLKRDVATSQRHKVTSRR
jgi:dihydrofolate synthase/folylpolyglutamate synthase